MKSLSEIETTSKRAARAAGFSWGISEEVGKCVRLLELFGLPGIVNLNSYLKEKNINNFENLKLIRSVNKPKNNTFCPIYLGVSLIDQIRTEKTFHCFINPDRDIPEDSQKIHNISYEMVKEEPFFKDIVEDFVPSRLILFDELG